jgi:hypothetical protein
MNHIIILQEGAGEMSTLRHKGCFECFLMDRMQ